MSSRYNDYLYFKNRQFAGREARPHQHSTPPPVLTTNKPPRASTVADLASHEHTSAHKRRLARGDGIEDRRQRYWYSDAMDCFCHINPEEHHVDLRGRPSRDLGAIAAKDASSVTSSSQLAHEHLKELEGVVDWLQEERNKARDELV
ncbi:hypothetical protein TorRG33x02_324410 [Trema orientale]|uniref:Uncharacterized protein n=1 Tax=Trema orientale TaxID=63057 RepID=A0A2P5BDV1_TREOI|nr:hypothetical protein TorRG33x02_324410 [Trema orientale]